MEKLKLIVVRGKQDQGKTSTVGLVYRELLKDARTDREHIFKEGKALQDSLVYSAGGALRDFRAILTIDGKKVGIASQGDVALWAKEDLEYFNAQKVSVAICCARTKNRIGSVYKVLFEHPSCEIVEEIRVSEKDTDRPIEKVKRPFVQAVIAKLFELL